MLIVSGPAGRTTHRRRGHPERPARLDAVMAGIADLHLDDGEIRRLPERTAEMEDILRVHDQAYLGALEAFCRRGGGDLDADTYAGPGSWLAARRAAGAGLAAVESLERDGGDVAFVVARPPGHHAHASGGMGFCLVNNVAVAAASLADRGERVLVLDWDVHHGNGTQAIFWDDPRVLYVSTHQWPLFPGSGRAEEVGGRGARGLTVNVPLPAGATGDVVLRSIEELAAPVVADFAPTWVLVSAGFDAHRFDPLADLALSDADFAALGRLAASMGPAGRLVLFLEGGYDLGALRASVTATLGSLVGEGLPQEPPTSGGPGMELIGRAASARRAAISGRNLPSR